MTNTVTAEPTAPTSDDFELRLAAEQKRLADLAYENITHSRQRARAEAQRIERERQAAEHREAFSQALPVIMAQVEDLAADFATWRVDTIQAHNALVAQQRRAQTLMMRLNELIATWARNWNEHQAGFDGQAESIETILTSHYNAFTNALLACDWSSPICPPMSDEVEKMRRPAEMASNPAHSHVYPEEKNEYCLRVWQL